MSEVTHQVLDVDDARARDVRTHLKEVHTHAPPAAEPSPPRRACRLTGTVHAWCDGRVHVPLVLHQDFIRKHGRLEGERDVDVEAKLFAFYAKRDATLPPGQSISENDFQFWRRAYAEEFGGTPLRERRATARGPDIRGGSRCPHETICDSTAACIARVIAEGRGAEALHRRRH